MGVDQWTVMPRRRDDNASSMRGLCAALFEQPSFVEHENTIHPGCEILIVRGQQGRHAF